MLALHPMSDTLTNLDDELVLMALIRSLPPEYTALCRTLLLDNSLSLDKLQDVPHSLSATRTHPHTLLSAVVAPLRF